MRLLNIGCGSRHHPDWINIDLAPQTPDVRPCDVLAGLPFADGELDAVYHSHVLEHLPRHAALPFLRECRRVLRPGGVLRVAVPDLEGIARAYLKALEEAESGDPDALGRHEWMTVELVDQLARHASGGEMQAFWARDLGAVADFVVERTGDEARRGMARCRAKGPRAVPAASEPAELGRFRLGGECHLWMYDTVSLKALLEQAGFAEAHRTGADRSAIPGFAAFRLDADEAGRAHKPDSLFMEAVAGPLGEGRI